MTILKNIAPQLVTYRPPRIATTLLVLAPALQYALGDTWQSSAPAAGTVVSAPGFVFMMRAWWLFRVYETAICPTAVMTTFITSDIYGITRNPMYLGMILMLAGIALISGSLWIVFATAVYAIILDTVFCRYEESKLLRQYGSCYADYLCSVRRCL